MVWPRHQNHIQPFFLDSKYPKAVLNEFNVNEVTRKLNQHNSEYIKNNIPSLNIEDAYQDDSDKSATGEERGELVHIPL